MKDLLSRFIIGTALFTKGKLNMKKFTYTFKKEHQIVKSWVALVVAGTYTLDQVPKLFNLRDIVMEVLAEQESKGE